MPTNTTPNQWLAKKKASYRKTLFLAQILTLISALAMAGFAWYSDDIISTVVITKQLPNNAFTLVTFIILLSIVRSVSRFYALETFNHLAASIRTKLRSDLLDQLHKLSPLQIASLPSAEISTTIIEAVDATRNFYSQYLPVMTQISIIPVLILIVLFPVDATSATTLLLTAPLIPIFMILIGKNTEDNNRRQWKTLTHLRGYFLDRIQGLATLKLFSASQKEDKTIQRISDDYRRHTMSVLKLAFLSSAVLEFFAAISIALVAVFVGFRLLDVEITLMTGLFALILAPEFYMPLRSMGAQYHAKLDAVAAAEKIISFQQITPADIHQEKPVSKEFPQVAIRFDQLSFSYPEQKQATLNNISFYIQNSEQITLVGLSGSGKSTIFNLIMGFIQSNEGNLLINEQAITDLDMAYWRQHISWIPQNPTIISGTISDNIALSSNDVDQEKLIQAAKFAHADDFINQLPLAYETQLNGLETALSGGQIQRIALARAFYRNTPIILLDEPGTALDPETENVLTESIKQLSKNRTLITIAHRLETIKQSQRILFIDKGSIIGDGNYSALIENNPAFQKFIHGEQTP